MKDTIINALRQTDDEPHDNRTLARLGWVLITIAGFIVVYMVAGELFVPSGSTSSIPDGAIQEWAKVTFSLAAVTIFVGSLVWPARKIETWLDAHYPDHTAEADLDYSIRQDLLASTLLGGLWGFRLVIGYAVIAILFAMVSVFTALSESGYPLSADEVTQLTVLNSFAIAILTTLLAGVAALWLINWGMKDSVEQTLTPATHTLANSPADVDEQAVATDGGEGGGA